MTAAPAPHHCTRRRHRLGLDAGANRRARRPGGGRAARRVEDLFRQDHFRVARRGLCHLGRPPRPAEPPASHAHVVACGHVLGGRKEAPDPGSRPEGTSRPRKQAGSTRERGGKRTSRVRPPVHLPPFPDPGSGGALPGFAPGSPARCAACGRGAASRICCGRRPSPSSRAPTRPSLCEGSSSNKFGMRRGGHRRSGRRAPGSDRHGSRVASRVNLPKRERFFGYDPHFPTREAASRVGSRGREPTSRVPGGGRKIWVSGADVCMRV